MQQRIQGLPYVAKFLDTGVKSRLLGVARQVIGASWLRTREFRYRGAIAPWPISDRALDDIDAIGNALAFDFGMRGVFGVDPMIEDHKVSAIEISPRDPSSAEVIERDLEVDVVAEHAYAFGATKNPSRFIAIPACCAGMASGFVRRRVTITSPLRMSYDVRCDGSLRPTLVPRTDTRIERAHPIVTIFAQDASCDEVAACRKARVAIVERPLYA